MLFGFVAIASRRLKIYQKPFPSLLIGIITGMLQGTIKRQNFHSSIQKFITNTLAQHVLKRWKKKMSKLTEYAVSAYETRQKTGFTANPHLWSSPAYYAHELAIHMESKGMTTPKDVRMSRGYSIWANDMLFKIHETKESIAFERIK